MAVFLVIAGGGVLAAAILMARRSLFGEGDEEPARTKFGGGEVTTSAVKAFYKIAASSSYAEAELDKRFAPGVMVSLLVPSFTGFKAWKREVGDQPDADRDRGHADWILPAGCDNASPRILYLHGGGYAWYSPQDVYRPATTRLAQAAGMPLLAIDYRKYPEFQHPAQLEDAVAGLEWLAWNGPMGRGKASALFLAGDSAGGGLALALAIRLRDHPIPGISIAGISVVSPWTDLSCEGQSYQTRAWRGFPDGFGDPVFKSGPHLAAGSRESLRPLLAPPGREGEANFKDPTISVLHADLHSLPPIQIHVGDAETMLSDSTVFTDKARTAGSEIELRIWPGMWHVFTQYTEGCGGPDAEPLWEALEAVKQQGDFLRQRAQALKAE